MCRPRKRISWVFRKPHSPIPSPKLNPSRLLNIDRNNKLAHISRNSPPAVLMKIYWMLRWSSTQPRLNQSNLPEIFKISSKKSQGWHPLKQWPSLKLRRLRRKRKNKRNLLNLFLMISVSTPSPSTLTLWILSFPSFMKKQQKLKNILPKKEAKQRSLNPTEPTWTFKSLITVE